MSITLSLEAELGPVSQWTGKLMAQIPFATSLALNRTAFQVQQALNYETTRYFDNPTSFTQRAFRFIRSSKTNLEVVIGAAPIQGRYLRFGIKGGARPVKGFERKFLSSIVNTRGVPSSAELVPTRLIATTPQGNVSLATIRRIQKGLATKGNGGFFYGQPRGGGKNANLPAGIYRRSKEQIFPNFIAIDGRAQYSPRYPLEDIAMTKAQQVFGSSLQAALAQAMATAR